MDYEYDEVDDLLGRGGGAAVYRARHPGDSDYVALKRPQPFDLCDERLQREIQVLAKMSHAHLMPVLAHGVDDEGHPWYTMPLARGSLKKLWLSGEVGDDVDSVCAEVLEHVCLGLGAMHSAGFLHRDVNPNNILALDDPQAPKRHRWVVADCGLARRPLGETTQGLTGSATLLGTTGYIAPEGFGKPHAVTEAADIYSLGRVLGWLTTRQDPVLIQPLLPEGPWRPVVRTFTFDDPLRRPQTMPEALEKSQQLRSELPTSEKAQFRTELREKGSRIKTDSPLWDLALENLEDYAFLIDDVIAIQTSSVRRFAASRPDEASRLGERMALHLVQGDWGHRDFDSANQNLDWVHSVLEGLVDANRFDLLEDVGAVYCGAAAQWNRFAHNDVLARWLTKLDDRAGDAMARAIHQSHETEFFGRITGGKSFTSASLDGLLES